MILCIGSVLFFFLGIYYYLKKHFYRKQNILNLESEIKKNPNLAILIPARNESKVIEELLVSIESQTIKVPHKNIFVIVEEENDETVKIVKKHQMNYFVRKKLNFKTKGYALQEIIEDLEEKKIFFDCYFIFDADNVLKENFIEKMLEDYQSGYAISTGYRKLKNKDHYFPVSAGLIFFIINELHNKNTLKNNGNLILSGTGYYIHGRLIKEWKTFPFHSLTEDYESSLYYTLHEISVHYKEDAIFYDEQPTNYKQSILQRSRWIKGYFHNWFYYRKKLKKQKKEKPKNLGSIMDFYIGVLPVICIVLSILLFLFYLLLHILKSYNFQAVILFLLIIIFIYFILVIISFLLLKILKEKTKLSKKVYFQTAFFHPIFLVTYIHAFFKSLQKNLKWEKITHSKSKKD